MKTRFLADEKFKREEASYGSMGDGRRENWGVTNARLWKVINGSMRQIRDGICFTFFRLNQAESFETTSFC